MVQINFALREINCKVVYYGPGMSGKTTNLEIVHKKAPEEHKGELTSIATDGDRTLFFDFMPLDLGTIAGMRTRFHLYTVPGQVYYNSTRKLVLQGADGIIFIADSDPDKFEENLESMENLRVNLAEHGRDISDVPLVIQYNKRDLPNAIDVAELDAKLNLYGAPTFDAVARSGEGVFPSLKSLSGLVLENISKVGSKGVQMRKGSSGEPTSAAAEGGASSAIDSAARPAPSRQAPKRPATPRPAPAPGGGRTAAGHRPAGSPRPAAPAPARSARPGATAVASRAGVKPRPDSATASHRRATTHRSGVHESSARHIVPQPRPTMASSRETAGSSSKLFIALAVLLLLAAAGVASYMFLTL